MERVDADLVPFAQNNPSGYRFAFGTDTATDDINVNYNDNIKKGWGTTPNEFPEVEDFNAFAYTAGYLISYLYQMGISEWNDKQKYRQYSRVIGSDGKIYKAKTGTDLAPNVNLNPTTQTANWEIDNQFNINSLIDKTTPADSDNFGIQEAGGLFKKLNWANLKTAIYGIYVGLTGNQTIDGIKNFTSSPTVPTPITGDNSTKVATTAYVDGNVGVANSSLVKTALNASGTAPIYACRAWVNFNGTGTVAIRASENVSSITDNGVGEYTVNFTTAMVDANYSLGYMCKPTLAQNVALSRNVSIKYNQSPSVSNVRIVTHTAGIGVEEYDIVSTSIFR